MNTPKSTLTKSAIPQGGEGTGATSAARRETAQERFARYYTVDPSGCWLWRGTFSTQFGKPTYGQFMLEGRRMGAHVASYILHNGPITNGLDCLHSCDVKACVNPAHLRLGTHTENIREAFAKLPPGYFAGERNGRARLTWADVRAIRAAAAGGARTVDLAREYGITPNYITAIKAGRKWPEVAA